LRSCESTPIRELPPMPRTRRSKRRAVRNDARPEIPKARPPPRARLRPVAASTRRSRRKVAVAISVQRRPARECGARAHCPPPGAQRRELARRRDPRVPTLAKRARCAPSQYAIDWKGQVACIAAERCGRRRGVVHKSWRDSMGASILAAISVVVALLSCAISF
jgi:hypothetical protein